MEKEGQNKEETRTQMKKARRLKISTYRICTLITNTNLSV
jgi:hypothetical protein